MFFQQILFRLELNFTLQQAEIHFCHSESAYCDFSVSGDNILIRLKPLIGCSAYNTVANLHQNIPAWCFLILFDTVLFLMTLVKAWKDCKRSILFLLSWKLTVSFVGKLAPYSQLFAVLLRDGFILYAVMLGSYCDHRYLNIALIYKISVLNIINLVFYTLPPSRAALAIVLTPIVKANFSITGSRLILNLRSASRSQILSSIDETKIETSLWFVDLELVGEP